MNRTTVNIVIAVLATVGMACNSGPAGRNVNANRAVNASTGPGSNRAADNLTREAFEKEKDRFAKEARDLGRKIGNGSDDLWIWTKTRAALASENDLRDSTIEVDVAQNVVSLTGSVPTVLHMARAESIARGIVGVKTVTNLLKVGPSTTPTNSNSRPKQQAN